MAKKMRCILVIFSIVIKLLTPILICGDLIIPANKNQVESWFQENSNPKRASLDPTLVEAEKGQKVIKVSQDGGGDFKTIKEAIASIPQDNQIRVIVLIGGGTYIEKINVDQNYVTFFGSPSSPPTLEYNDNAQKVGNTVDSASVTVAGKYFVAANIIFKNSAPRQAEGTEGAQAIAFRILGDSASFFSCKFLGFQDTLCDDAGRHFYKDCHIEGNVDFIWGHGRSIFLNTDILVIKDLTNVITAQFQEQAQENQGFSFVHCSVRGESSQNTFLGRALKPYATVIFSYTDMSQVLNPLGWSVQENPGFSNTIFFREYKNTGAITGRAPFSKNLEDGEATQFLSLDYIGGSSWLLPPPNL